MVGKVYILIKIGIGNSKKIFKGVGGEGRGAESKINCYPLKHQYITCNNIYGVSLSSGSFSVTLATLE